MQQSESNEDVIEQHTVDYSQGSGPTRYEFNVLMQGPGSPALAYLRTSSAANVGTDKDSEKRQRNAIQGFAERSGFAIVEEFLRRRRLRRRPYRDPRGLGDAVAFPCFSSRTMVLKGMLSAPQLSRFYPDLCHPALRERARDRPLALLDQHVPVVGRSRTRSGSSPQRRDQHAARQRQLDARARARCLGEFAGVRPVIPRRRVGFRPSIRVLELLVLAGRPLAHAVMMLVPEAWEGRDDLPEDLRGFYAYHEKLMEPWDGPASITFTDGRVLGAKLDRNGLRPGRWAQTDDGWVVLASETGALPLEPARIVRRGRLKPGALWIVDLERGALFADREVECEIASRRPYGTWASEATIRLEDVARGDAAARAGGAARAAADRVRLHPRGPRHPDRADGRDGQGADRLDGRGRARCPRCRTARRRCSPTSSSASRRSPTRRSTRCARTS